MASQRNPQCGFTLIELLVAVAIAGTILTAIGGLVSQALQARSAVEEQNDLVQQARFAMERMLSAVRGTSRLMLPLAENPTTGWSEAVRDPGVLAVTLDPTLDRDQNGIMDADNDGDGLIDEDLGDDNTNDGAAGIIGIDDDGDGLIDEHAPDDGTSGWASWWHYTNNDEDLDWCEEQLDGIDNDGDGAVDEDINDDMDANWRDNADVDDDDGDGTDNEEWLEPVVFYRDGSLNLIERIPSLTDVDGDSVLTGLDYTEQIIAENVTTFVVRRTPAARAVLVEITLELTGPSGESVTLNSMVRAGETP